MSWSVIGIFVLLVTWGFTQSISMGIGLFLASSVLSFAIVFVKDHSERYVKPSRIQRSSHQEFLANEAKRLEDLRQSGLLTEDELTVQNRLLSCNRQSTSIQS